MEIQIHGRTIKRVHDRYYEIFKNRLWLLLFYHDATEGELFSDFTAANYSVNDPKKYSILSELDDKYLNNGKYEFRYEYPVCADELESDIGPVYLQWRQTLNPFLDTTTDLTNEKVPGYEPIDVNSIFDKHFSGLRVSKASQYTLLDGETGQTGWHYSIGVKKSSYDPKLPGPIIDVDHEIDIMVPEVALWIKFPLQSHNTCKHRMQKIPNLLYVSIIISC